MGIEVETICFIALNMAVADVEGMVDSFAKVMVADTNLLLHFVMVLEQGVGLAHRIVTEL